MPKTSAFWTFYNYLRQTKIDNGIRYNRDALLDEANELWSEMGGDEKRQFKQNADSQYVVDGRPLKSKNLRYSSIPIDPGRRLRLYLERAEDFGDLASDCSFVMIDFNHRCCKGIEGAWTDSSHDYVPLELGLCKFSVGSGIEKVFHVFITPHEELSGDCIEVAEDVSKSSHLIPIHGHQSGISSSNEELSKRIAEMILPSVLVVCPFGAINRVKSCLKYMDNDTALHCMDCIEPDVFIEVMRSFANSKVDINGKMTRNTNKAPCKYKNHINFNEKVTIPNLMKTKTELSCQYHQSTKRSQYCAQSSSVVYALQTLSILTTEFDIPAEKGCRTYEIASSIKASTFY